jgi:hypothetical protein
VHCSCIPRWSLLGWPCGRLAALVMQTLVGLPCCSTADWQKGALVGKPYSLVNSTATQNGGQETTFISAVTNFTHHGMIYVPAGAGGFSAG